jgi:hypothetical protein
MRHLKELLISAALLASSLAHAHSLTAIGLYDMGTFYVDMDTLKRTGDTAQIWTALDYRDPQVSQQSKKNYKSTRMLMEFNCKQSTVRNLALSYHTGKRLTGETLSSEGVVGGFKPVPPDTPIFKIMRLVC